jgi:HAD superfamily hydrolase (TIGR01509 family)
MVEGVVFDMDGTLVDNMDFHHQAWLDFLAGYDIHITEEEFQEKNIGIITEIVPKFFNRKLSLEEIIALGKEKEAVYRNLYKDHILALSGLENFLQDLQKAEISIALATAADKGNIDFTLDALGIRKYFSAITGSEEVSYGKPHPDVYLKSAAKLQLSPGKCVAFEDTPSGIRSAQAAGMGVIGLATTHTREELQGFSLLTIIENYESQELISLLKTAL